MEKFVYQFAEGSKEMKTLLGGKGANLAEMKNIGLPVPPGFILSTAASNAYNANEKKLPQPVIDEIQIHLSELEKETGKQFGSNENPLLVSVRSGAPVSMPGMMDTILNLGLNDQAVLGLAKLTGDKRSSFDSYRRFIQMFGDVVFHIPAYKFEEALSAIKKKKQYTLDTELTAEDLEQLTETYQNLYIEHSGKEFPQDPYTQLHLSINAVFESWMNPRAVVYRRLHDIDPNLGTAVNIQAMVFGNTGEKSGTGIAFTRNPSTGEKRVFGEFLMNAQGEDVVAGIRTPLDITSLETAMPSVYQELMTICADLEMHYKDMQDIEFTIEKEKLYILQTRNGKRTTQAAVKVATSLVYEGLISKEEAILRIEPKQLDQLLHPAFDKAALERGVVLATGLPASPGAASGQIYFDANSAVSQAELGTKVILVRNETSPEDIEGMAKSEAILTAHGGMTSHAAVVARGMGKCCIAGCAEITISEKDKTLTTISGQTLREGDFISLDGTSGHVYVGQIKLTEAEVSEDFHELMDWVSDVKKLTVRVNADTPSDFETGIHFGAEGIGLCRTEHMFFQDERIRFVRQMIVSENVEERNKALAHLKMMQKEDFIQLFRIAAGRPVTIRLLDPPLHEFLPKEKKELELLAHDMGKSLRDIEKVVHKLVETNPMLGHRGARLAVTYPEIYKMQAEAIMESAVSVSSEGISVFPEIMIPLIATAEELMFVKKEIKASVQEIFERERMILPYDIGTMIEIPRACMVADEIAKEAQFFSFGTNDLTQLTFGFSRDDVGKFLPSYMKNGLLKADPFATIDEGVRLLVETAIKKGRKTNPHMKMGVCGEHGGDPASVRIFHEIGLQYVSCSPFRVPIARLAAAQAVLLAPKTLEATAK